MADVIGIELDFTVKSGSGLVAKDGSGFFKMGKATTSDPYVVVRVGKNEIAKTQVCKKTLDPEWNETFKWHAEGRKFNPKDDLTFTVYDRDRGTSDDPMGEVRLPLTSLFDGHVTEKAHAVQNCKGCTDAKGNLSLRVSCAVRRPVTIDKGGEMTLGSGVLAVGLGWDMLRGNTAIDLDTSCVALGFDGRVLMEESVYFAQLRSRSGAIHHTGDEKEGDEDLGQGDDEVVVVDTFRIPSNVCALYFIATVASEGRSFADVKSARMRLVDWQSGVEKCRYVPAMSGAHTALFANRIARKGPKEPWVLSAIGQIDHTARDWGTLVPEIKLYSQDLIPNLKVDVNERVAIMRKGGLIRVRDYCPNGLPPMLVMGLAWDVTNGVNIDLDASCILLDEKLNQLDLVYFGKLASSDGAIRHGGDEREGDEKGDDEKIFLQLGRIHPAVKYIGFVINSYSGQELDDVKDASCHLFDHSTCRDLASFRLTNCKMLDKHTALVLGMLFRDGPEWGFEIISEAAQGRTAVDNVDELQNFIKRRPNTALPPARLPPGQGQGMLSRAAAAGVGLARTLSGRLLGGGQAPVVTAVPIV